MESTKKASTKKASAEDRADPIAADQFWQFSLALYPLLQTELLVLQDQYSCNVNMLLLSAWRPFLAPLPQLMQALSPQQLTTQQVRQIRRDVSRALKDKPSDPLLMQLRQQLLDTELTAERLEQRALVFCCANVADCTVPASTLRQQYLDSYQVPLPIQQQLTVDLDQALLQLGLPQPFHPAKA